MNKLNQWLIDHRLRSLYKQGDKLHKWIKNDRSRIKQYKKRLRQINMLIEDELK